MNNIDYLGKIIKIKIDRPFGPNHPKHGFIYPVNYGYIPNSLPKDTLDSPFKYLSNIISLISELCFLNF